MAILFTPAALRQWSGLSAEIRRRIDRKLTTYAESGTGDVKKLKGIAGIRLRVGDWRVIFLVEKGDLIVVAVGHRREIYD